MFDNVTYRRSNVSSSEVLILKTIAFFMWLAVFCLWFIA